MDCKHVNAGREQWWTCPAFPDGIPVSVMFNRIRHTVVLRDQKADTVWEPTARAVAHPRHGYAGPREAAE